MSDKKIYSPGPGRPKDPRKRQAVLDAARRLFLQQGYEGASMDAIASEAGVSKLTVYSHFTDKETLYAAAVRSVCETELPHLFFEEASKGSLRQRLIGVGEGFCTLVDSPEYVSLHRLLVNMAGQDLKLAQLFYEAGPQRVCDGMVQLLEKACEDNELQLTDLVGAARHFFSLLKGDHNFRLLIGYEQSRTDVERIQHVEEVVDLFLRAYGAPPQTAVG